MLTTEACTMGADIQNVKGITLMENEEVLHNMRPSLAAWLSSTINLILSIITGGLWLLVGYVLTRSNRYVVTDERVLRRTGILSKATKEYRYEDVQQLSTGKSLIERLLSVGNISFATGTGGSSITFRGVPDHDEVANTIRNQMR